ncbi:MAG: hypothetical protein WC715_06240 [Patescibacteria group bacterium]
MKKKIFYVLLFLVLYVGLIAQTTIYDHNLKRKLASFDLNNDGVFSLNEQTQEQQKYFNLVIGDAGDNLMPITGLFISFIVTASVYVISKILGYITNLIKDR